SSRLVAQPGRIGRNSPSSSSRLPTGSCVGSLSASTGTSPAGWPGTSSSSLGCLNRWVTVIAGVLLPDEQVAEAACDDGDGGEDQRRAGQGWPGDDLAEGEDGQDASGRLLAALVGGAGALEQLPGVAGVRAALLAGRAGER